MPNFITRCSKAQRICGFPKLMNHNHIYIFHVVIKFLICSSVAVNNTISSENMKGEPLLGLLAPATVNCQGKLGKTQAKNRDRNLSTDFLHIACLEVLKFIHFTT